MKDEWRVATLSTHMRQEFQTAHVWHLHIRNDARRLVQVGGLQEVIRRFECVDQVTVRAEKIIGGNADRCIVINNRNHRKH
jgi:hypothetical protein